MAANKINEDENFDGRKIVKLIGEMTCLPLPDGWIGVNHYSGGIIYLHKKTRVVTWSRPYTIGSASLRKHDIPTAAIPCLHQKLSLLKCKTSGDHLDKSDGPPSKKRKILCNVDQEFQSHNVDHGDCSSFKSIHSDVQTADGFITRQNSDDVNNDEIPDYLGNHGHDCMSSVSNEQIIARDGNNFDDHGLTTGQSTIKTFESENCQFIKPDQFSRYLCSIYSFTTLTEEEAQQPIFGEGTRHEAKIELPSVLKALPCSASRKGQEKDQVTHKPGETHLSMLNDYCKRNLKKPIEWVDFASDGDQFIVDAIIEGIKYGRGAAKSKKAAKQLAAKRTLEILMPKQMAVISEFLFSGKELEVFDNLDISDPRVTDFTQSVGLPLPADVLSTCLKRNRAICNANIQFKLTESESNGFHTYEITCGKHSATGLCKNRKIGKQLASQAILKKIHPKLEKWGQLLLLYCINPTGLIKESRDVKDDMEYPKLPAAKKDLMTKLKTEMRNLEIQSKSSLGQRNLSKRRDFISEIVPSHLDL